VDVPVPARNIDIVKLPNDMTKAKRAEASTPGNSIGSVTRTSVRHEFARRFRAACSYVGSNVMKTTVMFFTT